MTNSTTTKKAKEWRKAGYAINNCIPDDRDVCLDANRMEELAPKKKTKNQKAENEKSDK